MRPVDGSSLINRSDVSDNRRGRTSKWLALDSLGKAAHYLCLDDSSLDENVSCTRRSIVIGSYHDKMFIDLR